MQGDTYPIGHSAKSRKRLTSSDLLKVGFWIQGPVAADTSHSGTIFDQTDASRHPVSWILISRKLFLCAMILLPLDLVSKNQLSTNHTGEFVE